MGWGMTLFLQKDRHVYIFYMRPIMNLFSDVNQVGCSSCIYELVPIRVWKNVGLFVCIRGYGG